MKPLFIPLKTEFFDGFKNGSKCQEFRRYGPRWNKKTCFVGRAVTLSRGYGKHSRLNGLITDFQVVWGHDLGISNQIDVHSIFKTLDIELACISIIINEN